MTQTKSKSFASNESQGGLLISLPKTLTLAQDAQAGFSKLLKHTLLAKTQIPTKVHLLKRTYSQPQV
jgi:hypothetical protein